MSSFLLFARRTFRRRNIVRLLPLIIFLVFGSFLLIFTDNQAKTMLLAYTSIHKNDENRTVLEQHAQPIPSVDAPQSKNNNTGTVVNNAQLQNEEAKDSKTDSSDKVKTPPAKKNDSCKSIVEDLEQTYQKEVKKAKERVQQSLAHPTVGSIITDEYIRQYNQEATALHEQYQKAAAEHGCDYSIAVPDLLSTE